MNEKSVNIVYPSRLGQFTALNSSFDKGVLRVCYTGRNGNNSFLSRETIERCIESIYNCPIVCRYDRELDEIGAHDVEIVRDDKGEMKLINATHPVGVVPTGAAYWWEEIDDGAGLHEYLCVDVLLWKRQEAYRKLREDGITSESMEINIFDGKMVDGVYVIDRFEFTAFCLLGTARPCFEGAALELFSQSGFRAQLAEMMRDMKAAFSSAGEETPDSNKGGEVLRKTEHEQQARETFEEERPKAAVPPDDEEDELEAGTTPEAPTAETAEPDPETEAEPTTEEYTLNNQLQQALLDALSAPVVVTECGVFPRYCLEDYDAAAGLIYAYDMEDWRLYGFPFTTAGDTVRIDFDDGRRMKYIIVAFDEGTDTERPAAFASLWEDISAQLTELRKFKADAESAALAAELSQVLVEFDDLRGVEEFESLCENRAGYDAPALREKCYAIRGRNTPAAKFSQRESGEPKTLKLHIDRTPSTGSDEPYGGAFHYYGVG